MSLDWLDDCSSPEMANHLRTVFLTALMELDAESRTLLLRPQLQIAVVPFAFGKDPVWAYFPVHQRRVIADYVDLEPESRVLVVFFEPNVELRSRSETLVKLKHHLGHALLYIRDPKAQNDCPDAEREWEDSRR